MPYASPPQSRFIHMKAGEGVGWAKQFVNDSKGTMYKPKRPASPNYLRRAQGPYKGAKPGMGRKHPRVKPAYPGPRYGEPKNSGVGTAG